MKVVTVADIGTDVLVGTERKIDGKIIAIRFDGSGVSYLVSWWNLASRNEEWLTELEFYFASSAAVRSVQIGFNQQ